MEFGDSSLLNTCRVEGGQVYYVSMKVKIYDNDTKDIILISFWTVVTVRLSCIRTLLATSLISRAKKVRFRIDNLKVLFG